MFEKICVFFMTGTGNSYKVAEWFSEVAKTSGLKTKMQQITTEKLSIELGEKTILIKNYKERHIIKNAYGNIMKKLYNRRWIII